MELSVPRVRGCEPYPPSMFAHFQRSERALLVACGEIYFQGVSTRKVGNVLEAMCGGDISASTVSRVASELDEKLSAFRTRRLNHTAWPYLMIDARYEKVRVSGRVVGRAVLTTVGFTASGTREVLDWRVEDSESEATWGEVFRSLKDRGMKGVELVVSDAHGGIRAAMERHPRGVAWQRCEVHFKREPAAKASSKMRKELMPELKAVLAGEDEGECLARGEEMAARWEGRYPAVASMPRDGLGDCLTVRAFPSHYRLKLKPTNPLERLMRTLKKRTRVVGVFPNRASCDRLIGAQLIEVHETWQTQPQAYFNMETQEPAT